MAINQASEKNRERDAACDRWRDTYMVEMDGALSYLPRACYQIQNNTNILCDKSARTLRTQFRRHWNNKEIQTNNNNYEAASDSIGFAVIGKEFAIIGTHFFKHILTYRPSF